MSASVTAQTSFQHDHVLWQKAFLHSYPSVASLVENIYNKLCELQLFIVFYTESLISHFPLLLFIYCLSLLFLFTLLSILLLPYFSRNIFLSFVTGSSSFLRIFFLPFTILLWHLLNPLLYSISFLTVTSTTPSSLFYFLTVTSTTSSSVFHFLSYCDIYNILFYKYRYFPFILWPLLPSLLYYISFLTVTSTKSSSIFHFPSLCDLY